MQRYEESAQVGLKRGVNADFKKELIAFANSDGGTFDKSRSVNQDLTFVYAEAHFRTRNIGFGEDHKRTLGLLDADGCCTNAALLLSDQCVHSVKCAVYAGTGKTKCKARKEFFGSILKQSDETYDYLKLCNNQNDSNAASVLPAPGRAPARVFRSGSADPFAFFPAALAALEKRPAKRSGGMRRSRMLAPGAYTDIREEAKWGGRFRDGYVCPEFTNG
ncbi:MAG: hypothetical protein LBP73_11825 [Clostridiales Family XIII bacterium]|jgi:hypothetical protein|nr:hypothetical protein [Clostridiales Family XIII bacterium]